MGLLIANSYPQSADYYFRALAIIISLIPPFTSLHVYSICISFYFWSASATNRVWYLRPDNYWFCSRNFSITLILFCSARQLGSLMVTACWSLRSVCFWPNHRQSPALLLVVVMFCAYCVVEAKLPFPARLSRPPDGCVLNLCRKQSI